MKGVVFGQKSQTTEPMIINDVSRHRLTTFLLIKIHTF